ncbi:MAG: RHS repeat protein, partial [Candidatus Aminicenantes bacterium]|nr:RHS repeat protein [Candidatus Aminicenantes bacterium]
EIKGELWSLNPQELPLAQWQKEGELKNFDDELALKRVSNNPLEKEFNMYLSAAITVTVNPGEEKEGAKLLSGDLIEARLSKDFAGTLDAEETTTLEKYISDVDRRLILDKKPSVRAESVDRMENFDGAVSSERPNSPANNPSMYGGVILHSGEFAVSEIDLQIPGRGFDFVFRRTYRSQVVYSGVLGWGWDHTYNRRILKMPGGDLLYYDGSGRRERFKAKKSGDTITGYEAPKGFFVKVKKYEDGTFKILHSNRFLEVFDSFGRLIELEDRSENKMEFYYNINGQLSTIVDTMERKFRLEYFPFEDAEGERMVDYKSGRIKSISDFSGRKITYTYKEGSGDLEKVDFAGRVKEYTYSTDAKDIKLAHNLLTYTDPEGQQVVSVSYDTEKQDKVISIDRGGSSTSFACGAGATVTDGSGSAKTFIHNDKGNPTAIGAGGYSTTFSTNDDGLITNVTYPEGNSVSYTYGGSDEDKRSKGNLISIRENPGSRGSSDPDEFTRTTTFSYENHFNQVTSVSTPGGLSISNSDQDEQGNFR